MAVPKCKVSKARRDSRRSNNTKLTAVGLVKCSNPETLKRKRHPLSPTGEGVFFCRVRRFGGTVPIFRSGRPVALAPETAVAEM